MQIYDVADYAGTGATATLASIVGLPDGSGKAKWLQVTGVVIGAVPTRVGSSAISTTRGIPIAANGAQFAPPIAELNNVYDLDHIYLLVQIGDTVSVAYAV